jgi:hypothetical protein
MIRKRFGERQNCLTFSSTLQARIDNPPPNASVVFNLAHFCDQAPSAL